MVYDIVQQAKELQQILDLQAKNLPKNISPTEAKEQGFVTVHHDLAILEAMNATFPHIIAKDADKVVGYALVMLQEFGDEIAVLRSMFMNINSLSYQGVALKDAKYFTMGQVCVDKAYRGQGVFSGLYQKMKTEMSPHFDFIITEVATRNTRSMKAHEKVGFKVLTTFKDETEEWAIVIWDWS